MPIETTELFGRSNIKVYTPRPKNIGSILTPHLQKNKDKLAIVTEEAALTYAELDDLAKRVAAFLQHACGVVPGDRVAVIIGNRFHFPVIVFACAYIGAIMVPINVKLAAPEIEYILDHSEPRVLMYESKHADKVEQIEQQAAHVLPEQRFAIDEPRVYATVFNDPRRMQVVDVDETAGAYLIYTSGTTGRPKGCLLTHINVIHSLLNYQTVFETHAGLSTLIAVPMFHVTGLVAQLLHLLFVGGTVYSMERYQNRRYIELTLQHKINFLFNVPTMFIMMSTDEAFKNNRFDFVKKVAYGGAPIYRQTYELLRESFPNATLHNAYGSTETTSPATLMPIAYEESKIASVGRAVPTAEIKVVDDDGRECAVNEVGELWIKGPMVIKEYWRNPEANAQNFTDGFWHSGDIGYMDEDGFFYVLDRKKDMINRAGEKVFSIEVEDVLKSHPKINEAAVIGIPDAIYGEKVMAVLVAPELDPSCCEEIRAFCRGKLAEYKIPERFEFVGELPKNAAGKVQKTLLKQTLVN